MKKFTLLFALLFSVSLFSQNEKQNQEETKMEQFSSKTGAITKYTDTKLPHLKSSYTSSPTKIRKIESGGKSLFFYQIENKGKHKTVTASIEYSDLIEVVKAINTLLEQVEADVASNPDYMENKFVTTDGFQVGYYISGGNTTWYLRLDKYSQDNLLFISEAEVVGKAFTEAKEKIEELKEK